MPAKLSAKKHGASRGLKCAIFYWVLVLAAGSAPAQSRPGAIGGRVLDETGAAIPGATVNLIGPRQIRRKTQSGLDGRYLLMGLPPGTYTVQVALPGFSQRNRIRRNISGNRVTADVVMLVAAQSESVTVREDTPPSIATDPSANASSTTVKQEDLKALSDDPDDLETDLRALAGPAAGLNPASIYIDGLSLDDQVLPSKAAISEVHINENPFDPEFAEMGLGRIEITTKPGTDKYAGELFFNYGDKIFNSRNPYAAEKPPFDLKQFGGSFGGPLGKRASFFLDVNRRDVGNGAVINAVTLDPATLAIINPYTQTFVSPFEFLRVSPRIDYQLSPKHTLSVHYGVTQNDYHDYGVGNFDLASRGADAHLQELGVQVIETAVLGANAVNQTQFQFMHQHHTHQANDPEPSLEVLNAFSGGGDPETFSSYIHHHYQVQNYTTINSRSHTWKFGAQLRAVSVIDVSEENFLGTYTFGGVYAPTLGTDNLPVVPGIVCNANAPAAGCATISSIEQYRRTLLFQKLGYAPAEIRALGGGATQFTLNTGNPMVFPGEVEGNLFAGDDWRIRPNLTLSLGLRFETQTDIPDHADFAPRLGFAWSPGKHGKFVIRGGFGMFYQRFNNLYLATVERYNGVNQQQYLVVNPDFFPSVPSSSSLQFSAQNQSIHTVSPSFEAPYLIQSMLSVERQLGSKTTLAATYVNSHGVHQFRTRDINAPLPGTYTGVAGSGVFPYPEQGPIYQMESAGLFNQNQWIVNVNTRFNKRFSLFGSYTLNYARSNTDGLQTFPANQYDLAGEYGPAENDIRNRGTLGGSIRVKWGLQFSPLIILQSGAPFNITTSQDIYGDGLAAARPAFASDPSQLGMISTPYGVLDPNPSPGEALVPRNYGRSPGEFVVNLRVGRTFAFGEETPTAGATGWLDRLENHRFTLTTAVSARNLLNHVNPGPIIGDINSPLFGQSNELAPGIGAFDNSANNRRLEFQLQLGF